jgi:hypothetical protein
MITGFLLFSRVITPGQIRDSVSLPESYTGVLPGEKIILFTDRTLYAVSENVLFKADYLIDNYSGKEPWSTVVYVELIRQDGHPVVQRKFQISGTGAEGSISIPEDLSSGVYYLKAYTKWMRNFPTDRYEYKPVRIINPFTDKAEFYPVPKDSTVPGKFLSAGNDTVVFCSAEKKTYHIREKVTLSVFPRKESGFQGKVSISVARKGTNDFIKAYSGKDFPFIPAQRNIEYYPEPRGISVSGKVINKETGKEIPYALVELALLYQNSFFSGFISDSRGQFLFTFPYYEGSFDFYIEANKENLPLSFHIDSEFCERPCSPGYFTFELTEKEKETAGEICENMEIDNIFHGQKPDTTEKKSDKKILKSFYGEPVRTIYTEKYIELPDLNEFIFELVPEFLVDYRKKTPVVRLVKKTTFSAYPSLCLVDNVPVTNMSAFISIPVYKIEKIELIDKPYISGSIYFNGIIQAFSKAGDMAGIELPKNSLFFNFSLYSGNKSSEFPDYSNRTYRGRIPDRRNVLYWNPSAQIKPGQEMKLSFYTADMKGEYEILIQGLSKSGDRIILRKTCFTVQ